LRFLSHTLHRDAAKTAQFESKARSQESPNEHRPWCRTALNLSVRRIQRLFRGNNHVFPDKTGPDSDDARPQTRPIETGSMRTVLRGLDPLGY
jgi:hypothetical protein